MPATSLGSLGGIALHQGLGIARVWKLWIWTLSPLGGESYIVLFSPGELMAALSQCCDSSPGPDDIPYAFLRHISDIAFNFLLGLYIFIWRTGDFSSLWSVAIVLPISKPGKRSTTDALLSLDSSICAAFANSHHHVIVFFDLEKAYDTTWCHDILLSRFEFGLRGCLPIFIKQFLSDRLLRARVGSILSEACALEDGVPQGSILNVTLFAVAINSAISVLPDGFHSSLYVDDLSISFSVARMPLIERKLQHSINRISPWVSEPVSGFQPRRQ